MKKNLIIAVFASLQGLEKCVEGSNKMYTSADSKPYFVAESLSQQSETLKKMRHSAIRLQLHLARDDWDQAVRSLQIFYGLRQMVRPDIMATFRGLANQALDMPQIEEHVVMH